MAAYMLTRAGARVTLLEAGPLWWPDEQSDMWKWNYESMRRGSGTRLRPFGEFDAGDGGWDIDGEPYTRAPGTTFDWYRGRMLGGRTNHWGRISLRFGPHDFRRKSLDGLGDDWPISYDDIKPWYDQVDRLIGIFGSAEGLPNEPDGIFLPPPEPRCWEKVIQKAATGLGKTIIPSRLSILTQAPQWAARVPLLRAVQPRLPRQRELLLTRCAAAPRDRDRTVHHHPECDGARDHRCCPTVAREVCPTSTRPRAARWKSVAGWSWSRPAPVSRRGSSSTRNRRGIPSGLANGSGVVGKYLTDTVGAGMGAFVPSLMNGKSHNCDGVGGAHLYFPWVLDNRKLDFPRGYHIEIWGGRGMPGAGAFGGMQDRPDRRGIRNGAQAGRAELLRGRTSDSMDAANRFPPRTVSVKSIPRSSTGGASRAALPLEVGRLGDQPGEAHAEDIRRADRCDGRAHRSGRRTR